MALIPFSRPDIDQIIDREYEKWTDKMFEQAYGGEDEPEEEPEEDEEEVEEMTVCAKTAHKMTIEEVESCDYAYIILDKDDPDVHCFLRLQTYDEFVTFERPLKYLGRIDGTVHSKPSLWKDSYGTAWVAFDAPPAQWQVSSQKRRMQNG